MAQFASDAFTDTAGTALSTHSADWTLHTSYGTGACVISDANRVRRSNNNSALFWHAGTPASADYEVSADLFTKETDGGASNTGVVGRVDTAANTCYHARYGGSSVDGWQLFKLVAGTATQLGSTSSQSLTDETTYAVKLKMAGTTIELFKEGSGSATVSVTDSAISAAGKSGIRFVGTGETNTTGLHLDNFSADDVGAASHPTSGALSAQAATVAGTATHLTLHATSGALSAQAATVAGSAVSPHLSTGALTAQAATVAGEAEVIAAGGTHATTGALSAAAATVAGDAAHLTLHTTTGALTAQAATVAGSAAHLTLHTTSGALAAGEATIAGTSVHSGDGATPDVQPAVGGGGWAWAAPRKKRHDYLSPPTREQMAERVRQQREALGILPKPAQKRIEAAVKKEARRAEPSLAPLAPVAVEVAQDTGAPLRAVIEAIQRTFDTQRGLVAARMEADAAQRREEEAAAAERMRIEAEEAQREWQRRLPQLLAADDELLRQGEEARKQAIKTIRQVQQALMALLDR